MENQTKTVSKTTKNTSNYWKKENLQAMGETAEVDKHFEIWQAWGGRAMK